MAESEAPTTPGAMIAAARRQRGLTPDDLAERTKIPAGLLAALEADEYHRLSGPLYARSFLRACAAELALDVAEVFAAYERQVGGPQREPSAAAAPPAVRIRRVGLPWGRLAAGGLVLAAAVLLTLRLAGPRGATGPAPAGEAGADAPREPARAAMGQATDAGSAEAVTGPGGPGGAPRAAPAGLPDLVFSDGRTWPLVARLRLERRAAVRSRSDGEPGFTPVQWATAGAAPAAPATGVVAGVAYADGSGYVVYWGVAERLDLALDDGAGCALTVNGEPWPLVAPPGGGELVVEGGGGSAPLP